jgi:hypothetical protein
MLRQGHPVDLLIGHSTRSAGLAVDDHAVLVVPAERCVDQHIRAAGPAKPARLESQEGERVADGPLEPIRISTVSRRPDQPAPESRIHVATTSGVRVSGPTGRVGLPELTTPVAMEGPCRASDPSISRRSQLRATRSARKALRERLRGRRSGACSERPRRPIVHVAASDLGTAQPVPPQRPHRRSGVLPIQPQHPGQRRRRLEVMDPATKLVPGNCAWPRVYGHSACFRGPAFTTARQLLEESWLVIGHLRTSWALPGSAGRPLRVRPSARNAGRPAADAVPRLAVVRESAVPPGRSGTGRQPQR